MIREETLRETGRRKYEDPDGQFLELIKQGSNTITVLTKVDSDKAPRVESSPIDPTDMTVNEVQDALEDEDYDWNDAALRGLIEAEQAGSNRVTALDAIKEKLA
jgi:hypothetical protein